MRGRSRWLSKRRPSHHRPLKRRDRAGRARDKWKMMNTDRGHQIVGLCGFTLAQAAEAAEAIRAGINAALDV